MRQPTRHRIWYCAVPLVLAAGCVTGEDDPAGVGEFTLADASRLLTSYTSALATGDTGAIRSFWSERSSEREGFWLLHAWVGMRLDVNEWPEFLERHHFEIRDIRPGPQHHAIHITWLHDDSVDVQQQSPRDMVYYVVFDDNRWVLENPIDALTRGWLTHETECFLYRYPPNIRIEDHMAELQAMDEECGRILQLLDLDLQRKIEYFRARTPQECGELLLQPPAYGFATRGYPYPGGEPRGFRVVVSQSFLHPHELAHLLHVEARIPSTTAVLSEGFATALGGGAAFTAGYALVESRNLTSRTNRLPLRELLAMPDAEFFGRNYETYVLAGGFFRFLLEQYGLEPLTRLATETRGPGDFEQTIPRIYGVDVDELDTVWQRYLSEIALPNVGFTVPRTAESVFSMVDQAHDDVGDGDYTPPERFEDGVFDLTKFEVLRDTVNVHFRLEFRNLAAPVTYRDGGEQFSPTAVVAINRGASDDGHLGNTVHGVRFADGLRYDVMVNVGVRISLSDAFGRVYFSTPNVWEHVADPRTRTMRFSLPILVIGEPDAGWRYFVGIGLSSERAMNFIHGGPAPAYREHPVFLSGGNSEYGNPAFIDILLPEDLDQAAILGDYDGATGRLAVVPMVGER